MQNAHTRFGTLRFVLRTEKRSTSIAVPVERMMAEVEADPPRRARAHLLSLIGSDAQVSALSAALSNRETVSVEGPDLDPIPVNFTEKPEHYRGTIVVAGQPRPLCHLISVSQEFAGAGVSDRPYRTFLMDSTPDFIWTSLAYIHGLPGLPAWAAWFCRQLRTHNAMSSLLGLGCDPVLIAGSRKKFLSWLGEGVANGELKFPPENGPVLWPPLSFKETFFSLPASSQSAGGTDIAQ